MKLASACGFSARFEIGIPMTDDYTQDVHDARAAVERKLAGKRRPLIVLKWTQRMLAALFLVSFAFRQVQEWFRYDLIYAFIAVTGFMIITLLCDILEDTRFGYMIRGSHFIQVFRLWRRSQERAHDDASAPIRYDVSNPL